MVQIFIIAVEIDPIGFNYYILPSECLGLGDKNKLPAFKRREKKTMFRVSINGDRIDKKKRTES